jgi:hypothetical protein
MYQIFDFKTLDVFWEEYSNKMFQIFDFKASNMLWQAYCNDTSWNELPNNFQLRTLRDCLTIYGRTYEN